MKPNPTPDDGMSITDPDEDLFKIDADTVTPDTSDDEPEESLVSEVIHEPRPETTPPVTGTNMPM